MFPKIEGAPGLAWRSRADGRLVALWVCRADIVKRGYTLKTQQVWAGLADELADTARALIVGACRRLQDEMLGWAREGTLDQPRFDGSVKSLIETYRRDADSPYHKLRFRTRRTYDVHLAVLEREVGARHLAALRGKDFLRWYEAWRDGDHPYRAHARITTVRLLLSFGIVLEFDHCARLKTILGEMQFEQGAPRSEALTAAQAVAIRKAAHEIGRPSIALAQAMQFELMLRQKDVIGEWVPLDEPGLSSVTASGLKWLYGVDWSEVGQDLVLRHRMSKSNKKKLLEFDLKTYPMVVEELATIPQERRAGPMIKEEPGELPWLSAKGFRDAWRRAADRAGVPRSLQNRDSRAGGITEASDAGGDLDTVRHHAGHSDGRTTERYSRGGLQRRSNLAVLRVAARAGNKPKTD